MIGTFPIGQESIGNTVPRNPPVPTIASPVGTVLTSSITVTWSYLSALGRPQTHYTVLLQVVGAGSFVVDTGMIASAATSHVLDYQLSPFVNYRVWVGVHDGLDGGVGSVFGPGWTNSEFFTEFSAGVVYPDNPQVGSIYEIGINGVGYMLKDDPESELRYRRQNVQLQPERLATGNTPFSEAIERYTFIAHSDWRVGEGQRYLDRPDSVPSRYFYSEWINPFEPGEIRCLPTPEQHISTTFTGTNRAVVASGSIYVQTGSTQLTALDVPGGVPVVFSTGNPGGLFDVATDGTFWYATDGAQIRRNNTPADPGVNWSTVDVTTIEWCSDRLAGLDTLAIPPNFTTFTPAGAEENVGGWQSFTDASLRGLCGGDGFIWFGVNRAFTGEVRAYTLGGAAGSTTIALTLPEGEEVDNLYFYLGNVMLASRTEDDRIKIYRCVPNEGRLTPQFIVEYPQTFFGIQVQFAGMDRFVAFAWYTMTRNSPESGIGVIDLETSGYARWQAGGGSTGFFGRDISSVVRWAGDFAFVVRFNGASGGLYGAAETPSLHAGFIETSVSDLATNVTKVLDSVSLTTRPLAGTVEVLYSTSTNESFTSLGTMSGSGVTTSTIAAEVFGSSFGFRLVLTPVGNAGPVVKLLSAKTYPLGIVDQVVSLPVRCANRLDGLNGSLIPESSSRAGVDIMRRLEGLTGEVVQLQDVDWPVTKQSSTFLVVSAEVITTGVFDRQLNRRVDSGVVVLALRRPSS